MKILQIMAGAEHGGAETAFVDMCLALHEAGEHVEAVTRTHKIRVPALEKAGIRVHCLPFGGPADIYTPWRIGKIISEFSPQIVQTWMSRAAKKTPNWTRVKTAERYLVVSRLGGYYKIKNFRNADYFVVITPDLRSYLNDSGIEPDRIRQINNFAETGPTTEKLSRATFDTPPDAPVLLTLARLHDSKALDVALEALATLPGFYLWIAGDGPLRSSLQKLAKTLGIADRVRFLGWRTDRAELLRAADICVFCSRREPFGTVFVQAWANKTPVIVSDADGPKQFCKNGADSLMVPKDDPQALAAAARLLVTDQDLKDRIVSAGYHRYKSEFTKERCVQAYLDFYIEILQREKMLD